MPLPTLLSYRNAQTHKNIYGHVLILAGSANMLGAAALCGLAAMRSGAGLVTIGVPSGLNTAFQKKISPVIMTLPLPETAAATLSPRALRVLKPHLASFQSIVIGPGLSRHPDTQKFIRTVIETVLLPMVIDADALTAVAADLGTLSKTSSLKILTPHPGEMARLLAVPKNTIEQNRKRLAVEFAAKHQCVLLLKGAGTVVASEKGEVYVNSSGNPGMATAGSGDVLSGMLGAFLARGLSGFEAARWGAYFHGKAGDLAAKTKTQTALIAVDIIESLPKIFKRAGVA